MISRKMAIPWQRATCGESPECIGIYVMTVKVTSFNMFYMAVSLFPWFLLHKSAFSCLK